MSSTGGGGYNYSNINVIQSAVGTYACEVASQMDATTELVTRVEESCAAYKRALPAQTYTAASAIILPVMRKNNAFLNGINAHYLQGIQDRYKKIKDQIDIAAHPTNPSIKPQDINKFSTYVGFVYDVDAMLETLRTFNVLLGALLQFKQQ